MVDLRNSHNVLLIFIPTLLTLCTVTFVLLLFQYRPQNAVSRI